MKIKTFFVNYKYEFLLFGLLQHLFIGIFLSDLTFYIDTIWAINMLIVGISSMPFLIEKSKWKIHFRHIVFLLVFIIPLSFPILSSHSYFLQFLSIIYILFFILIFIDVISYLIKPSYINKDIITAAACGYLLLVEISIFLMLFLFFKNPASISNIDQTSIASTYVDLVYLCSIVHTSIGFGDIVPTAYNTKLAISLIGIVGQFYSVVLIGILISKFTSKK